MGKLEESIGSSGITGGCDLSDTVSGTKLGMVKAVACCGAMVKAVARLGVMVEAVACCGGSGLLCARSPLHDPLLVTW